MNIYTKHNTVHHDPEITADQSLIYLGTPSHTVTPYDQYARFIVDDARKCFRRAGITAEIHTCHRRLASVGNGSGPGGMVRFGDDMIPPDVQAVVSANDEARAKEAWENYQFRRRFRRPVSVVGNLHYSGGKWNRGGSWPAVCGNALALAIALKKSPETIARIVSYASKHGVTVRA